MRCSACSATLTMLNAGKSLQCCRYTRGQCSVSHYICLNKANVTILKFLESIYDMSNLSIRKRKKAKMPEFDVSAMISRLKLKEKRITEAYEEGIYTLEEFRLSKNKIDTELSSLYREKASNKKTTSESSDKTKENTDKKIYEKGFILENERVSQNDKNVILKSFIEKIVFERSTSSLEFYFK